MRGKVRQEDTMDREPVSLYSSSSKNNLVSTVCFVDISRCTQSIVGGCGCYDNQQVRPIICDYVIYIDAFRSHDIVTSAILDFLDRRRSRNESLEILINAWSLN